MPQHIVTKKSLCNKSFHKIGHLGPWQKIHVALESEVISFELISQGSVSMQLLCVGTFSSRFITNFPQNMQVKKLGNWSIFGLLFLATL